MLVEHVEKYVTPISAFIFLTVDPDCACRYVVLKTGCTSL